MKVPSWEIEDRLFGQNYVSVIGVDEVGRGPLAGPVVAVALRIECEPRSVLPEGVRDSKQLTAKARERIFEEVEKRRLPYGLGCVSADRIDEINILNGTKAAMREAIGKVAQQNSVCLIDGNQKVDKLQWPQIAIPQADERCFSVAAASVIAKVIRDRMMAKYSLQYPGYGFDRHVGYGTVQHREAIVKLGPCPIHRRSFLKKLMSNREKGAAGEDEAVQYLVRNGYQVLERNVRFRIGEIDVVAKKKGRLHFVEVRSGHGVPHEELCASVGTEKQRRMVALARFYLERQKIQSEEVNVSFDLITVSVGSAGHDLRFYENMIVG